jgi:hypothetical protein
MKHELKEQSDCSGNAEGCLGHVWNMCSNRKLVITLKWIFHKKNAQYI